MRRLRPLLVLLVLAACGGDAERSAPGGATAADEAAQQRIEQVLDSAVAQLLVLTDSIERQLRPVPLLTGAQEAAMRRYGNAQQLARARQLGVQPRDSAHLIELVRTGRLVELEDSTALWIVRKLDHSAPYVTPDTHALLTRIGERFQAELAELGLPSYRMEVTSVLRTPADQAALRRVNPNAARDASAHQYATTLDVAYNSFAAPAEPAAAIDVETGPRLGQVIERIASALLEATAARNSRELQAVLGEVFLELQARGQVMVTLERQQPVFHFTVARPQA